MTLFDERERAFEQMFVHNEEARFRALARRNRLLGQWAAEQMRLTGQEADAYVAEIGRRVVERIVDESLVDKLRADFDASGISLPEHRIREKMAELTAVAGNQIRSSTW